MIEFNDFSFRYSNQEDIGIKNINLKINKGECILLCGKSGCGKTTLTRVINGLIPNYFEGSIEGTVKLMGEEIKDKKLYDISSIVGSVFQNPSSQFFNSDSTNELAFLCENLGYDREQIIRKIEKVTRDHSLEHLLNRNLMKLSGGEKQKIACASISVANLDIMILDEPSSNLDFPSIKELKDIIRKWKFQGKTIVIAEHRLHYLKDIADRIIYMESGEIVKDYSREEFLCLSDDVRSDMGLRFIDIDSLNHVKINDSNSCSNTIRFEDFKFSFEKKEKVLDINSLEIPEGLIVAIIGHNGAGKSTLAKSICGINKRTGKVIIDDKVHKWKKRLSSCYMVMQDVNHQLFTESVLDEVLLSMKVEDVNHAENILKSLDIYDYRDRHPISLSGGQKQRTAIASSLVSNRQIVVFDEPTSGLDYKHMKEVSELIKDYSKYTKLMMIITHDPELILNCCNYVVEVHDGKVYDTYSLQGKSVERLINYYKY
jgi:energy-coupling factor transport system ATP-binding protein